MENPKARFDLTVVVSILASVMLITGNLWGPIEPSEARYAEISREMLRSGDWIHPTLLNIHHYHKPPVTYWLTAASYSVFGVNAFATRFLLVASFCIQVFVLFRLANLLLKNKLTAFYTAIVYATLPLVLISVRALTTDPYLNLFVLLSIYVWTAFLLTQKISLFYLTCLALGLGFMTKGPVIFIVPLSAAVGMWSILPRPRVNIGQAIFGLAIFSFTAFFWFGYLISENESFADYFFLHHLVDRVVHAEVFSRKEPWYYYLPIIPLVTTPWIVAFVIQAFTRNQRRENEGVVRRIGLWWFVIPLIIFSIASSKLVLYVLPLSIGFSFVAGQALTGFSKTSRVSFLSLSILVYIIQILLPFFIKDVRLQPVFAIVPGISLVVSVGCALLIWHSHRFLAIVAGTFAVNLLIYSAVLFHFNSDTVNTTDTVTNFIKQNHFENRQLVVYNELLPSLAFGLEKDIVSVYDGNKSLKREVQFEEGTAWQSSLVDTTGKRGIHTLDSMFLRKSLIVTRHELPQEMKSIMHGEWKREYVGKWTIYLN